MADHLEKNGSVLGARPAPTQRPHGPSLRQLEENERFEGCYLVRSVTKAVTQFGAPYLRLGLADLSGKLNAYIWNLQQVEGLSLKPGCYVYVEARTRRLRPQLVASIQSIDLLECPSTLIKKASQS